MVFEVAVQEAGEAKLTMDGKTVWQGALGRLAARFFPDSRAGGQAECRLRPDRI